MGGVAPGGMGKGGEIGEEREVRKEREREEGREGGREKGKVATPWWERRSWVVLAMPLGEKRHLGRGLRGFPPHLGPSGGFYWHSLPHRKGVNAPTEISGGLAL